MSSGKIVKPIFYITISYIFSLLINVVVQITLASTFGVGLEIDSYFVAYAIPSFFILILNTSISKVFVPIFIDIQTQKGEKAAWSLASNFMNITLLVIVAFVVFSELLSKYYIQWLAPGLNKASYDLAVSLIHIFLPAMCFTALSALLNSIYYANNRFLRPSFALVLNSLAVFIAVIFFKNRLGISCIAYGVLGGSAIHFLFLSPILSKKYSAILKLNAKDLSKLLKLLLPVVIGAMFYKAAPLIEKNIASSLSMGSISYLGYAYRIIPILLALTTTGISTTLFPLLSRYASQKDWTKAKKTFLLGINSLLILISPLVIYFIVLRIDIIKLLYERGQFTNQDTLQTASVFIYYLIALFFMVISTLPSQIYTITQNTKILIPIGILETAAYIIYCFTFAKLFGLQGVAIAFALYYFIAFLINYAVLYLRIKSLSMKELLATPGKIILTASCSGLILYCLNFQLRSAISGRVVTLLFIAALCFFSLIIYLILMHFLKIDEIAKLKNIILSKLKGQKPDLSVLVEG